MSTVVADNRIHPDTSLEALAKLKLVFAKDGSTTAGYASKVSDGAGVVLPMRRDIAMKKGLPVLDVYWLVGLSVTNTVPLHSANVNSLTLLQRTVDQALQWNFVIWPS